MSDDKDIKIVSEYGTTITAKFESNDTVVVNIIIHDNGDYYSYVIVAYLPEYDGEHNVIHELLHSSILPHIFRTYISDPFLRIKLFYEFGMVDVVEDGTTVSGDGNYYIAVDRFFEPGIRVLDIIGCCPDGTSYFTPESALIAYKLLDLHSVGEDYLPILDHDQVFPTKFNLFSFEG